MGLDVERLLAGLGLTTLADDPGMVALAVDRVQHGALRHLSVEGLVEAGAARWRGAAAVDRRGGAGPGGFRLAAAVVGAGAAGADRVARGTGAASAAYVTACWFRREDVDEFTAVAR